jgi:hypothetical protein
MTCPRALDLTERPLDAPILTSNIPELITQLKQETWKKGARNSMTLFKGKGLRLVLVVMRAKTAIASHWTDSPISLRLVEEAVSFKADT